jgi:hypothetical protein
MKTFMVGALLLSFVSTLSKIAVPLDIKVPLCGCPISAHLT